MRLTKLPYIGSKKIKIILTFENNFITLGQQRGSILLEREFVLLVKWFKIKWFFRSRVHYRSFIITVG